MTSKGIFEAIARGFGLILTVQALLGLAALVLQRGDALDGSFWLHFGVELIAGIALVFRGGAIANRVYASDRDDAH